MKTTIINIGVINPISIFRASRLSLITKLGGATAEEAPAYPCDLVLGCRLDIICPLKVQENKKHQKLLLPPGATNLIGLCDDCSPLHDLYIETPVWERFGFNYVSCRTLFDTRYKVVYSSLSWLAQQTNMFLKAKQRYGSTKSPTYG